MVLYLKGICSTNTLNSDREQLSWGRRPVPTRQQLLKPKACHSAASNPRDGYNYHVQSKPYRVSNTQIRLYAFHITRRVYPLPRPLPVPLPLPRPRDLTVVPRPRLGMLGLTVVAGISSSSSESESESLDTGGAPASAAESESDAESSLREP